MYLYWGGDVWWQKIIIIYFVYKYNGNGETVHGAKGWRGRVKGMARGRL